MTHKIIYQHVGGDRVSAVYEEDGVPIEPEPLRKNEAADWRLDAVPADSLAEHMEIFKDGRWMCEAYRRATTVPFYDIRHMHRGSRGGSNYESVEPVQGRMICYKCQKPVPVEIMDSFGSLLVNHQPGWFRGQGFKEGSASAKKLKPLTHMWFIDQGRRTKYRMLVHHCAPHHPAGVCFSRGIPLHMIDMPPFSGECKTCRQKIPGGVKIAINLHTRKF